MDWDDRPRRPVMRFLLCTWQRSEFGEIKDKIMANLAIVRFSHKKGYVNGESDQIIPAVAHL
jgi:hypothetical protein